MTIEKDQLRIITVGGGIAGLTLALASHRLGVRVDVYERNDRITEIGAGLALGPNSSKIIEDLGIKDEFNAISTRTTGSNERHYRRYNTNELYLSIFSDKPAAYNHRADFVKILADAIPSDQIHLSRKLIKIEDNTAIFNHDGVEEKIEFDVLIGTDGIHSKVRSLLFSQDEPVNSYQVMYRDVIDYKDLKGPFEADLTKTIIWPGPGKRHVVTFPIDQNRRFAAAAVVPIDENVDSKESWKVEGDINELLQKLEGFNEDVKNIFRSFKKIKIYGLFDRENIDTWVNNQVLLIGDAAHPGQPHQGANAGQAIEDAYALSYIFKYSYSDPNQKKNINKWLKAFEKARKQHAEDVVLTSRRMGYIFNNLVDNEQSVKLIKNNFSWIYGHDIHVELEKAIFEYFGPEIALNLEYSHLDN